MLTSGEMIRILRRLKNMSMMELSFESGINLVYLQNGETGKRQFRGTEIQKIYAAIRAHVSERDHRDHAGGIIESRFWSKVIKTEGGCWLWIGGQTDQGYGRFWDGTKKVLSHRYSFILAGGIIPEGLILCHTCDTPSCVNPDHLFTGTHLENMQDAKRKVRLCRVGHIA